MQDCSATTRGDAIGRRFGSSGGVALVEPVLNRAREAAVPVTAGRAARRLRKPARVLRAMQECSATARGDAIGRRFGSSGGVVLVEPGLAQHLVAAAEIASEFHGVRRG